MILTPVNPSRVFAVDDENIVSFANLVIEELEVPDSKLENVSYRHVVALSHLADFPEELAHRVKDIDLVLAIGLI